MHARKPLSNVEELQAIFRDDGEKVTCEWHMVGTDACRWGWAHYTAAGVCTFLAVLAGDAIAQNHSPRFVRSTSRSGLESLRWLQPRLDNQGHFAGWKIEMRTFPV